MAEDQQNRQDAFNDRLESFKCAIISKICSCSSAETLAKAGFRFTQNHGILCRSCDLVLCLNDLKMGPLAYHKQHSPKCAFILEFMSVAFTKEPISRTPRSLNRSTPKTPWQQLPSVKPLIEMNFSRFHIRAAIEALVIRGMLRKFSFYLCEI